MLPYTPSYDATAKWYNTPKKNIFKHELTKV